ncbi:hypothetical protein QBC47DRAFT_139817 [Echria macrotheca]|uniref:tRNA (uracil-O(2)-)-methyltransferase n=1 Tax=Echria macrotheca TaxID=438768 RepID=A0AAJ0BI79_9PEZI|nr:hypothetical protein QBC47DRAFT_139817 [Echria macrotheca]
MGYEPEQLAEDAPPIVTPDDSGNGLGDTWVPLFRHGCSFGPDIYHSVMLNLIKNPNINSTWLFRANILHDVQGADALSALPGSAPEIPSFRGLELQRCMIRKLIPRNTMRDKPLDQTCLLYGGTGEDVQDEGIERTLVVYLPHVGSQSEMPFYHPVVRGIAFLHEWNAAESVGSVSISYLFFDVGDRSVDKLVRTAWHLLKAIYKHGEGRVAGYKKRVHHDVLIPQARVQDRYTALKNKYARDLIKTWAESTDPEKHVFEDLSIAAFLIELWADMYKDVPFPGFVDIGCGNGLLVYILNREGYSGWGFDAQTRKSWASYSTKMGSGGETLQQLVLLPPPVSRARVEELSGSDDFEERLVHDGRFPKGTFIISNHADELTPWTPILATISDCPFIMIPCCSHDLTGSRFRAPRPADRSKADSSYASLVAWVAEITKDCGWEAEQEMLRIPSTRNTAIVGRKKTALEESAVPDINAIVQRYGGTAGYLENVIKLVSSKKGSTAEHIIPS